MTRRQWLLLIIAAVIGYGTVAFFFQRYEPAAQWGFALDRRAIEAQTKAFAKQHGIDAANWTASIEQTRVHPLENYLASIPRQTLSPLEKNVISPLQTRVKLLSPDRSGRISFLLGAKGQILDYNRDGIKSEAAPTNPQSPRANAEAALQQAVGENARDFVLTAEVEPEKGSKKYSWTYTSPTTAGLRITAEVLVAGDLLIGIKLRENLPPGVHEKLRPSNRTSFIFIEVTKVVINVLLVIIAVVLFFLALSRKELDLVAIIKFSVLMIVLSLARFYLEGQLDDFSSVAINGVKNSLLTRVLPIALFWLLCLGYALLTISFWATGEAMSAKYQTGREAVFAALLRGQFLTRTVGKNLLAGVLGGGLLAALPILLAIVFRLAHVPSEVFSAEDFFVSYAPALTAIIESAIANATLSFYALVIFGFLAPLLGAYLRTGWWWQISLFVLGLFFLLDTDPDPNIPFGVKILLASLVYGVLLWLYRQFDLLAVLSASFAAGLLMKGFSYWMQPSPTLHQAGLITLGALGLFGLFAFLLTIVGADKTITPRVIAHTAEDQGERDRLKASFEVARKAQDKMLPAAAPEIPGLSIAALCRPARECGGDLYDFIAMPDGKLGVVVADVSGKGVPAALYMTLTKGLFASVTEELDDPGAILCEVNKHLYEVCKRKMFVTLFFGIIDPLTKTMSYARAGHNPPVLRSVHEQATQFLKPAGIGLGLNSGKTFDRILKVEQVQLQRNDVLVLYSDGITEAMNEWQEEYGEERLMNVTAITDGMQAEETLSALLADVSFFLGKTAPQDDQTLVVIRVK